MLKNIIKQVWNQRRMNGWILLELIIAGFFLWTVVDPVYMLAVQHFTPKGYEEEGRFVLQLSAYSQNSSKRDTTVTHEHQQDAFQQIVRQVNNCPEVESVVLVRNSSFPNGGSWSGTQLYADSIQAKEGKYVHAQLYDYNNFEEGNIFKTYGMKDALTGGDVVVPEDAATRGLYFVSEGFAKHMFGTIDVVGKKIYTWSGNFTEIAGVFKDFKHRDFEPAYPLVVTINNGFYDTPYMHYMYLVAFKLKDGVDAEAFEERFTPAPAGVSGYRCRRSGSPPSPRSIPVSPAAHGGAGTAGIRSGGRRRRGSRSCCRCSRCAGGPDRTDNPLPPGPPADCRCRCRLSDPPGRWACPRSHTAVHARTGTPPQNPPAWSRAG